MGLLLNPHMYFSIQGALLLFKTYIIIIYNKYTTSTNKLISYKQYTTIE